MKEFYVYILASQRNGTLYTGLASDLKRRLMQHRDKAVKGFTQKYGVTRLVYFESYNSFNEAFERERRMKKWKRAWKIELIEKDNPQWKDLSEEWFE